MEDGTSCLAEFSSASLRRLAGLARPRWLSMADSVPEALLFKAATYVATTMAVERLAQYLARGRVTSDYAVVGVVSRIFAAGDDF